MLAIVAHLVLGWAGAGDTARLIPLWAIVVIGGIPLVWEIVKDLIARTPGADLLAAIAIVTAVLLDEWLVAAIIVLMLSGGEALEEAATARAARVLEALAKRAPTLAHRLVDDAGRTEDIPVEMIEPADRLLVLPTRCARRRRGGLRPRLDGRVVSDRRALCDHEVGRLLGALGAINGEDALVIRHQDRADSVTPRSSVCSPRPRRTARRCVVSPTVSAPGTRCSPSPWASSAGCCPPTRSASCR